MTQTNKKLKNMWKAGVRPQIENCLAIIFLGE
jgi:hypothetical protein